MIYAGTGIPVECKFPAGIEDGEKTSPMTIREDGDGEFFPMGTRMVE
jgi:hypothetical protein